MEIADMTREYAADIIAWRYPPPYDCYDLAGVEAAFLTDPGNGYLALVHEGRLIGFRVFGVDGQVPGGVYDGSALDTGGGLRPELTGRGLGRQAIATGLTYGTARFRPAAFRVTVAGFNLRAQRVLRGLDFTPTATFEATTDGRPFVIMTRPAGDSVV
ncbi:GNAT family N-acetyltransferase [Nonomuraea jiangxiensis]|uniref:GNAT family N-acetyltransferase n=1 Tax=Nonomuraea jiangxiensis TaxID=633440 RepID=UPI00115FE7BC|nr:GNAT family protein [Nonomuraea jiangxiensis]